MKKLLFFLVLFSASFYAFSQNNKDFLIVNSFYQGKANNCASIALIKAAMLNYGYKNLFVTARHGANYNITLKDGTQFIITEAERQKAVSQAKFIINDQPELGTEKDSVLLYVYLAYACIAKSISINGYWTCEKNGSGHSTNYSTYDAALSFISEISFCTDYCYRLLGYKGEVFDFKKSSKIPNRGGILYSKYHAVATYDGKLDCFSDWLPITQKRTCKNRFKWYIVLQ